MAPAGTLLRRRAIDMTRVIGHGMGDALVSTHYRDTCGYSYVYIMITRL